MIIIPGQSGTYRHSRRRVTALLADSGLSLVFLRNAAEGRLTLRCLASLPIVLSAASGIRKRGGNGRSGVAWLAGGRAPSHGDAAHRGRTGAAGGTRRH